jgi:hypothetical protein
MPQAGTHPPSTPDAAGVMRVAQPSLCLTAAAEWAEAGFKQHIHPCNVAHKKHEPAAQHSTSTAPGPCRQIQGCWSSKEQRQKHGRMVLVVCCCYWRHLANLQLNCASVCTITAIMNASLRCIPLASGQSWLLARAGFWPELASHSPNPPPRACMQPCVSPACGPCLTSA